MPTHPLVKNVRTEQYDVYIGRPTIPGTDFNHWGNPFSHRNHPGVQVITQSVEQSVYFFMDWLSGGWPSIEPERRQWILDHIHELKGKTLGCFGCSPCHGDVLAKMANDMIPSAD